MTLTRHILNILQRVGTNGLFSTTLEAELHVALGTRPGQLELREALADLERLGWIAKSTDPLTRDTQWTITEAGKEK